MTYSGPSMLHDFLSAQTERIIIAITTNEADHEEEAKEYPVPAHDNHHMGAMSCQPRRSLFKITADWEKVSIRKY